MKKSMQDTIQKHLSPEMYESIISFQEMRIEALQKRNTMLEHMLFESNPVAQATNHTQDWITDKLFGR